MFFGALPMAVDSAWAAIEGSVNLHDGGVIAQGAETKFGHC